MNNIIGYLVEVPSPIEAKTVMRITDDIEINSNLGVALVHVNMRIVKLQNQINELSKSININDRKITHCQLNAEKKSLLMCKLEEQIAIRDIIVNRHHRSKITLDEYEQKRDTLLTDLIKSRSKIYREKEHLKVWCYDNKVTLDGEPFKLFGIDVYENKRDYSTSIQRDKLADANEIYRAIEIMTNNNRSLLPSSEEAREVLALKLVIPGYIQEKLVFAKSNNRH